MRLSAGRRLRAGLDAVGKSEDFIAVSCSKIVGGALDRYRKIFCLVLDRMRFAPQKAISAMSRL